MSDGWKKPGEGRPAQRARSFSHALSRRERHLSCALPHTPLSPLPPPPSSPTTAPKRRATTAASKATPAQKVTTTRTRGAAAAAAGTATMTPAPDYDPDDTRPPPEVAAAMAARLPIDLEAGWGYMEVSEGGERERREGMAPRLHRPVQRGAARPHCVRPALPLSLALRPRHHAPARAK